MDKQKVNDIVDSVAKNFTSDNLTKDETIQIIKDCIYHCFVEADNELKNQQDDVMRSISNSII